MSSGPWVHGMSVGVPRLDDSHKAFFAQFAEIADHLRRRSFDEAERACRSLMVMVALHSAEEEALLLQLGYPHLSAVIEVQKAMREKAERLLALIVERSAEACGFAAKATDDLVGYLLRGDINFKSFVQDAGRLT